MTIATFSGFCHVGDQPTEQFYFQADKSLKDDKEALESIMRIEMRKRLSKLTSERAVIEDIFIEYDEDSMLENIIDTVKNLDRYEDYEAVVDDFMIEFYQDDDLVAVVDAGVILRTAIDYINATGNESCEIRYDGLKTFEVEAVY